MSESAATSISTVLPTMPPPGAIAESVLMIGEPGAELVGVLARPADPVQVQPVGVVIVVGGPQTRVGSHRQFAIMARALAAAGHACLRFDYTGMGDSPGTRPDFEKAGPDIGRACDALLAEVPSCERIALWGLCDGATTALLYAREDPRIALVIAANPWARSEITRAQAVVAGHYRSRLTSPEFWKKLLTGKVDLVAAGREALGNLLLARKSGKSHAVETEDSLPARLIRAFESRACAIRLQLSGRDLTAAEFEIVIQAFDVQSAGWVSTFRSPQADHTFSDSRLWLEVIEDVRAALGKAV